VQFTRRQAPAVGNLQFVAEQVRRRLLENAAPAELADDFDPATEYQDAVLKAVKEAKATLAMPKIGVMLRLLSYLKPHKKPVTIGLSLAMFLTALQLLPPYLTKVLVDDILRPVESGRITDASFWLWVVIGSLAAVWSISEFISFIRLRLMALTGEKVAKQLREDLYSHMQKLSL
jgi:ATP-binding cassette subfamily B protein